MPDKLSPLLGLQKASSIGADKRAEMVRELDANRLEAAVPDEEHVLPFVSALKELGKHWATPDFTKRPILNNVPDIPGLSETLNHIGGDWIESGPQGVAQKAERMGDYFMPSQGGPGQEHELHTMIDNLAHVLFNRK